MSSIISQEIVLDKEFQFTITIISGIDYGIFADEPAIGLYTHSELEYIYITPASSFLRETLNPEKEFESCEICGSESNGTWKFSLKKPIDLPHEIPSHPKVRSICLSCAKIPKQKLVDILKNQKELIVSSSI